MRGATLLPSLFAAVILGATPLGMLLAAACSSVLGVADPFCLIGLYFIAIGGGAIGIASARLFVVEDRRVVDSLLGVDDANGQDMLTLLLLPTLAIGTAAIVFSLADAVQIGCVLGAAVFGIAPEWLLRGSREAPALPRVNADERALPEIADGEESLHRLYAWTYAASLAPARRESHQIELRIRQRVLKEFRDRPHPTLTDGDGIEVFVPFVRDGITEEVERCALLVAREARRRDLPTLDFIDFVLAFTRGAIVYVHDCELYGSEDYYAYPVETLAHKEGDCDDHAILGAALLTAVGIDTVLILVHEPAHLAIGVAIETSRPGRWVRHAGRNYYYGEVTPEGDWRLGEIPSEYSGKLTPIPVVSM